MFENTLFTGSSNHSWEHRGTINKGIANNNGFVTSTPQKHDQPLPSSVDAGDNNVSFPG